MNYFHSAFVIISSWYIWRLLDVNLSAVCERGEKLLHGQHRPSVGAKDQQKTTPTSSSSSSPLCSSFSFPLDIIWCISLCGSFLASIREKPSQFQERECSLNTWSIDFYTTRGGASWWSVERMQLKHMKHRLLYNQRSCPLVVSRENAALTHEAYTSIQPGESPPGDQ